MKIRNSYLKSSLDFFMIMISGVPYERILDLKEGISLSLSESVIRDT